MTRVVFSTAGTFKGESGSRQDPHQHTGADRGRESFPAEDCN